MSGVKITPLRVVILAFAVLVGASAWIQERNRSSEPDYPANATNAEKTRMLLDHRLQLADPQITRIIITDTGISITYQPKRSLDGDVWVKNVFTIARKALTAIQGASPDFDKKLIINAQLQVYSPGEETRYTNGLILQYDLNNFRNVDFSKILVEDVGELASNITFRRFGWETADEYCAVSENKKYSAIFCRRSQTDR